jgi:hypothetical protein
MRKDEKRLANRRECQSNNIGRASQHAERFLKNQGFFKAEEPKIANCGSASASDFALRATTGQDSPTY